MANEGTFRFNITGNEDRPFVGYNSQSDPTKLSPQYLVGGSKNTYVDNNGNVTVRPGLKAIGGFDETVNGVVASYEFESALTGATLPIRVLENGVMQFRYAGDWYDLATFNTTRFIFSPWWDAVDALTLLVMVNGDHNLYSWSGAINPTVGSTVADTSIVITGGVSVESITLTLDSGTGLLEAANNERTGTFARSGVIVATNPSAEYDLTFTIAQTSPFPDATVGIRLVTSFAGLSPEATTGYVLIGPTAVATVSNLLGFFQDPGNTTSTHIEITDSDSIDAIGDQSYVITSSLGTTSTDTWIEQGFVNSSDFNPNPKIIISGVTYDYALVTDHYLINLSGSPTPNTLGVQGVTTTTNTPSADVVNDFIVTLNNQIFVGSYTNKTIFISSDVDFTDFSLAEFQVEGTPDFVILDEYPTGLVPKGDSVYAFAGNSSTYLITPNVPSPAASGTTTLIVLTTVTKRVGAGKSAALAQEFITTSGEDILYLAQDHQLRQLGTLRNIVTQKTPALSKVVRQELIDTNFTGGALRAIDEFIYATSPVTGRTFLYQIRDDVDNVGNLTALRLWHPFQEWGISRTAIIDGVTHGYSSTNPNTFQLWDTDQWHDDSADGTPSPYECRARFAYQSNGLATGEISFNMVYYEGYVVPNSALTGRVRFDYLGGTHNQGEPSIEDIDISSGEVSPVLFVGNNVAEIGTTQLGEEENGGGIDLSPGFPKFRIIQDVDQVDVFEYQVELFSYTADSRWSLKCYGANPVQSSNNPVFLRRI